MFKPNNPNPPEDKKPDDNQGKENPLFSSELFSESSSELSSEQLEELKEDIKEDIREELEEDEGEEAAEEARLKDEWKKEEVKKDALRVLGKIPLVLIVGYLIFQTYVATSEYTEGVIERSLRI